MFEDMQANFVLDHLAPLELELVPYTRRETLEGAEQAIDSSVAHYVKKLEYVSGPKVVKTFK